MTFADMQADVYRRLHYQATPATAIQTRVKAFLNETQRELVALPGMERLRDDQIAVTLTANRARCGLPPQVARVKAIVDRVNNHRLRQVTIAELRTSDPSQAFIGGYPLRFAPVGYSDVQLQPAAATGLWVVSSAAGDTTQSVKIQTITTGGHPYSDSVTVNGTTRAQVGTTATRTDHVDVVKCYLSAVAVGYVSLYDAAAAGTELVRIAPGQTRVRSLVIEVSPIQTVDTTEYVDYTRVIAEMVDDTDGSLLPPDFHWLVALGARLKEYEFTDDTRLGQARADYLSGMNKLRSWVLNDGDKIASLRPTPQGWSQLGAMFPAGS